MNFVQVDVFADRPYSGNPLAVFPDAGDLEPAQMQAIAREMNLSESVFVTAVEKSSYDVRIFTPQEEMQFAGHPTLGTAWVLHSLGTIKGSEYEQRSPVGVTKVTVDDEHVWLHRPGRAFADLEDTDFGAGERIAHAIGLKERDVGLEARELGRSGRLRPAYSDAGLHQLMIPVQNLGVLERAVPQAGAVDSEGAYCFTAVQAGRIRARGFFGGLGVPEDPGTGSAAAALGIYLADRLGRMEFEIMQGVEIGRPCRILVRADEGTVRVGGTCRRVASGELDELP